MKAAALSLAGEFHAQLGPIVKAMMMSNVKDDSVKGQLEKKFDSSPFDPSIANSSPTKRCLHESDDDSAGVEAGGAASALGMDIPKTDLMSELPEDILDQLVSKE